MRKKKTMERIRTGAPLQPFRLEDCIEQFNRGNWPGYEGVELGIFIELLKSWLVELDALRSVRDVLTAKLMWVHREKYDLKETLALMADGEGDDASIYQEMAKAALKRVK